MNIKIEEKEKNLDIVRYLSNGFCAKQISEKIGKSHRTVETYIFNLREKYNCKSQSHLVAFFLRSKLIN